MLNAAESEMDESAEDDAERQRHRMQLYAPPPGTVRAQARRAAPGDGDGAVRAGGMSAAQAAALNAQMEAEERRLETGGG